MGSFAVAAVADTKSTTGVGVSVVAVAVAVGRKHLSIADTGHCRFGAEV